MSDKKRLKKMIPKISQVFYEGENNKVRQVKQVSIVPILVCKFLYQKCI